MNGIKTSTPSRLYSTKDPPSLDSFIQLCQQSTDKSQCPQSSAIVHKIPVYDLSVFDPAHRDLVNTLQDEWNHILLRGAGVFILKNFFDSADLISRVNQVFDSIIAEEASTTRGDHFAASGKNARIWNSYQKHAEHDPASFVEYYSNPWLQVVAEAWLGPAYQVTAQVNIVKPGGKPQMAHRDYHLGFQTAGACERFPKAMQIASQLLTLQGAVAHSNVSLDSGPTRLLPFSQQFDEGYMAYRLQEFVDYFNSNWVSTELELGDAVFFNPALFHAAGENVTADIERSANLLQISSAFGKTMETIDNIKIIEKCWDDLRKMTVAEGMNERVKACIQAMAAGYPFPTNLDNRPPAPGGMAPQSEADILLEAVQQDWNKATVISSLKQVRKEAMS